MNARFIAMRRARGGILGVFIILWAFAACLSAPSCSRDAPTRKPLTVAFVPGVADPFYHAMERGMRAAAAERGMRLIVADYPNTWGPQAQIPALKAVAAAHKDIDLLVIAPTSVDALIAPLNVLHERGIQILTVDTFLGDGNYAAESDYSFPLAYIGTNNESGGKRMAEQFAELLGKRGKIYVNTTNPDVSSVEGRVKGFLAGIAEFPNMEVVKVDYCLDVQELARAQTLAALQTYPDIVGVFGTNVFSAQGSHQAVVDTGLTGAITIASWDATPELIAALRAGQIDLVLAQKPAEMGALAIEWGAKYLTYQMPIPKKITPGFEFFTRDNVNDPAMQPFIY